MTQPVTTPKVGDRVPSSTGGIITYTKTGLIHTMSKNR
jgi:hypothetical protein